MKRIASALILVALITLTGCNFGASGPGGPTGTPTSIAPGVGCAPGDGKMVTTAAEVKYEELQVCSGVTAKLGDTVTINYTASAKDGDNLRPLMSTYDKSQPYTFKIGNGIPPGVDQGVIGMTVGGKRRLTLIPSLGFGAAGDSSKSVPANATLVYEVQMMEIKQ